MKESVFGFAPFQPLGDFNLYPGENAIVTYPAGMSPVVSPYPENDNLTYPFCITTQMASTMAVLNHRKPVLLIIPPYVQKTITLMTATTHLYAKDFGEGGYSTVRCALQHKNVYEYLRYTRIVDSFDVMCKRIRVHQWKYEACVQAGGPAKYLQNIIRKAGNIQGVLVMHADDLSMKIPGEYCHECGIRCNGPMNRHDWGTHYIEMLRLLRETAKTNNIVCVSTMEGKDTWKKFASSQSLGRRQITYWDDGVKEHVDRIFGITASVSDALSESEETEFVDPMQKLMTYDVETEQLTTTRLLTDLLLRRRFVCQFTEKNLDNDVVS